MRRVLVVFVFLGSLVFAKNNCSCVPTTGKTYIGEARQYNWLGFTIHWVCDYECNAGGNLQAIKGTYKKFYAKKSENGLEGICEGMKYVPKFNAYRNDYVYMWDEKIRYVNPAKSPAVELRKWAQDNNCL